MPATAVLPKLGIDTPIMYEDEGRDHMGDSRPHSTTIAILNLALSAHFKCRQPATVLENMNLFYHPVNRKAYCSPDLMVVPAAGLKRSLRSYRIGKTGPAPFLTVEVLSRRTFQQGDLSKKPKIYRDMGVKEYLLVDTTGKLLEERLLLRTLDVDGAWVDDYGDREGVISKFGLRIVIDDDGQVRVFDIETGRAYLRPEDVEEVADENQQLLAEIARLKALLPPNTGN